MIELPADLTDPLKLADWLELYALLSPDHNASSGDLESELRRASLFELDDDTTIERKTIETFGEIELRVQAAREAYPFDLDYQQGTVQVRSSWQDFPAYTFCLCLSYFGLTETKIAPRLFEQVACWAAKGYLQGEVAAFGSPRSELPKSFSDAVTKLCALIGEGGGYREQPSLSRKDDTLDLVAWKDFVDKHPSKVLMFGQCAAGDDWQGKLGALQPITFCDQWMQPPTPICAPLRSFFMPHRIGKTRWELIARKSGVLFDRCRIAFWAHQEKADYSSHIAWVENMLAQRIS
jgi:hypothetical protein